MGSSVKMIMSIMAVLGVILSGIFLPAVVSGIQDANMLEKVQSKELEKITVDYNKISIIEKLRIIEQGEKKLYGSYDNSKVLSSNKNAIHSCVKEYDKLKEMGILPAIPFNESKDFRVPSLELYFLEDSYSQFAFIWNISFSNEYGSGYICLDNETGKILTFMIKLANTNIDPVSHPKQIAKDMGKYLGLHVVKYTLDKNQYDAYKQIAQRIVYEKNGDTIDYDYERNKGYYRFFQQSSNTLELAEK